MSRTAYATPYKIEKNVPLPGGRPCRFPFPEMRKGDSFLAPKKDGRYLRAYASLYGKRHNVSFTVRSDGNGSLRCWRIK